MSTEKDHHLRGNMRHTSATTHSILALCRLVHECPYMNLGLLCIVRHNCQPRIHPPTHLTIAHEHSMATRVEDHSETFHLTSNGPACPLCASAHCRIDRCLTSLRMLFHPRKHRLRWWRYSLNPTTTVDNCGKDYSTTAGCTHYVWTDFNGGTCWLKNAKGQKLTPNVR